MGKDNRVMYLYVAKLTIVIAAVLAGLSAVLSGPTKYNQETAKKKAILACVLGDNISDPNAIFDNQITVKAYHPKSSRVFVDMTEDTTVLREELSKRANAQGNIKYFREVDMLSENKVANAKDRLYMIYEFKDDKGEVSYILGAVGNGLWDKIWGYVAVDAQGVIQGAAFEHKAETPGLGAEIKERASFAESLKGKKLYNDMGKFVSITVQKRTIKKPDHDIMGISGATITCDGVTEMMQHGLGMYEPFLDGLRDKKG